MIAASWHAAFFWLHTACTLPGPARYRGLRAGCAYHDQRGPDARALDAERSGWRAPCVCSGHRCGQGETVSLQLHHCRPGNRTHELPACCSASLALIRHLAINQSSRACTLLMRYSNAASRNTWQTWSCFVAFHGCDWAGRRSNRGPHRTRSVAIHGGGLMKSTCNGPVQQNKTHTLFGAQHAGRARKAQAQPYTFIRKPASRARAARPTASCMGCPMHHARRVRWALGPDFAAGPHPQAL